MQLSFGAHWLMQAEQRKVKKNYTSTQLKLLNNPTQCLVVVVGCLQLYSIPVTTVKLCMISHLFALVNK